MVVGTSMDYESQASMERGCSDGFGFCSPAIEFFSEPVRDDRSVDYGFALGVLAIGLGEVAWPVLSLHDTADRVLGGPTQRTEPPIHQIRLSRPAIRRRLTAVLHRVRSRYG